MEPTAPSRYEVQFTASAELRQKLERRTQNALLGEHDCGKEEVVARYRRSPDRVLETAVAYGAARRLPGGPLLHSP
jgi:hypothetical protein